MSNKELDDLLRVTWDDLLSCVDYHKRAIELAVKAGIHTWVTHVMVAGIRSRDRKKDFFLCGMINGLQKDSMLRIAQMTYDRGIMAVVVFLIEENGDCVMISGLSLCRMPIRVEVPIHKEGGNLSLGTWSDATRAESKDLVNFFGAFRAILERHQSAKNN